MRTKKKIQSISSDKICFNLPAKWEDLSEKELRYVYLLRCMQFNHQEIATHCLIRFLDIKVYHKNEIGWGCGVRRRFRPFRRKFYLKTWEVQYYIGLLSFLEDPGTSVVNISRIGSFMAVDKRFHDVPFSDYLLAENFYQGYLYTQNDHLLISLAKILYQDKRGRKPKKIKFTAVEKYSVIQWYYSLKNHFAAKFTDFFQRVDGTSEESTPQMPDMTAIMNSEIRALTGGDITKETEILAMDTWRALTELNEKAREVRGMEERKR